MKKQLLVLASLITMLFSSVQAEVGINVGVSGNMGLFGAGATETEDGEKVIITTTRPELICACGIVLVHPEDSRYSH